jgi:cation-transporting ATPase 13A3/4/5
MKLKFHSSFKTVQENYAKSSTEKLFQVFASCHQVYLIEGEMSGDTLDIKMLQFSKWKLEPLVENPEHVFEVSHANGEKINVLKIFEFQSEL